MKKIVFIWGKYAPYHMDRIQATAKLLKTQYEVVGIQKTGHSQTYAWDKIEKGQNFPLITLFPDKDVTPRFRILPALLRILLQRDVRYIFFCNYEQYYTFLSAIICRLMGKKVFIMMESKFDDKPRKIWREWLKSFFLFPYHGGMASGQRIPAYMRFLRFGKKPITSGYDTISITRVQKNAGLPAAPKGTPFSDRHFIVVSRFVPKKNLPMLITAYATYRKLAGKQARELHLCGSGEEENTIRERIANLKVDGVVFHGFQQEKFVANLLGKSLALLIPSTTEQWGLVVNEALAIGLPILCSNNIGSRDDLVQTGVNGFMLEDDNPQGWANLMWLLSKNEEQWRQMAKASCTLASKGDTKHFAKGVQTLVEIFP